MLAVVFDFSEQLLHDRVPTLVHLVSQCLRLLLDPVILGRHAIQILRNPCRRIDLRFRCNVQQLGFLLIPKFTEFALCFLHFSQITVFHLLLLDVHLHFTQLRQLLLELLPESVLLRVLRLELLQPLVRLLQGLGDIPVLLLTHANGLILFCKRILV